jgi:hypothetical protein
MRMLVRGAKPGRAFLGGQGLDVLTHSTDRTVKYRRILSNSGKFQRGTQEWALDNWVKESATRKLCVSYWRLLSTLRSKHSDKSLCRHW